MNRTHTVENFPSHKSIHGMDLMSLCREQVEELGVSIEEVEDVERVDFSGAEKRLFTSSGEEYTAGAVIVATGRNPVLCRYRHHSNACIIVLSATVQPTGERTSLSSVAATAVSTSRCI